MSSPTRRQPQSDGLYSHVQFTNQYSPLTTSTKQTKQTKITGKPITPRENTSHNSNSNSNMRKNDTENVIKPHDPPLSTTRKSILNMSSITRSTSRRFARNGRTSIGLPRSSPSKLERSRRYMEISPKRRRTLGFNKESVLEQFTESDRLINSVNGTRRVMHLDQSSVSEVEDLSSPIRNRKMRVDASVGLNEKQNNDSSNNNNSAGGGGVVGIGLTRIPSLRKEEEEQEEQKEKHKEGKQGEENLTRSTSQNVIRSQFELSPAELSEGAKRARTYPNRDNQRAHTSGQSTHLSEGDVNVEDGDIENDGDSSDFEILDDNLYLKDPSQTLNHTQLTKIIRDLRNSGDRDLTPNRPTEPDAHSPQSHSHSRILSQSPDIANSVLAQDTSPLKSHPTHGHQTHDTTASITSTTAASLKRQYDNGDGDDDDVDDDVDDVDDDGDHNNNYNGNTGGDGDEKEQESARYLNSPNSRAVFSTNYVKKLQDSHKARYATIVDKLALKEMDYLKTLQTNNELQAKLLILEQEAREFDETQFNVQESNEQMKIQLRDANERIKELNESLDGIQNKAALLQQQLEDEREYTLQMTHTMARYEEDYKIATKEKDDIEQELVTLRNKDIERNLEMDRLIDERERLTKEVSKVQEELESLRIAYKKVEANAEARVDEHQQKLKSLQEHCSEYEEKLKERDLAVFELRQKEKDLSLKLSDQKELVSKLESNIEDIKKTHAQDLTELNNQHETRVQSLELDIAKFCDKEKQYANDIDDLQLKLKSAEQNIQSFTNQKLQWEKVAEQNKELEALNSKLEKQIKESSTNNSISLEEKEKIIKKLTQDRDNLNDVNLKHQNEIEKLEKEIEGKIKTNDSLTKSKEILTADVSHLQQQISDHIKSEEAKDLELQNALKDKRVYEVKLEELLSTFEKYKSRMDAEEEELSRARAEIEAHEAKRNEILEASSKLRSERQELSKKIDNLTEVNYDLQRELEQVKTLYEDKIANLYKSLYDEYLQKHKRKLQDYEEYYESKLAAKEKELRTLTRDFEFAKMQNDKLRLDNNKLIAEKCASPEKPAASNYGSRYSRV